MSELKHALIAILLSLLALLFTLCDLEYRHVELIEKMKGGE